MTITENNKLIAEFMGAEAKRWNDQSSSPLKYEMYGIIDSIEDDINAKHFYEDHELKFHTSWDWIMPVVERIHSIGSLVIGNNYCYITDKDGAEIDSIEHGNSQIELVYQMVVEFIKWYNK